MCVVVLACVQLVVALGRECGAFLAQVPRSWTGGTNAGKIPHAWTPHRCASNRRREALKLRADAGAGDAAQEEQVGVADEFKVTIVGAVVQRQGKILMVERLNRSRGYFEFPGGKVEEGESDGAALVRELKEELAVEGQIVDDEPVAVGLDGPVQLRCYRAEIKGEPQVSKETLSFRWVGLDELKSLAVPPADQAVVQRLLEA